MAQATVDLNVDESIWERFFTVYPLVIVGTRDENGGHDLAPKHLAMPMSWQNYFGFVCHRNHHTYQNVEREKEFTVTYARPDQVVLASLAASPRVEDGSKPIVEALPVFPADTVNAAFLTGGYLFLECELHEIYDGFGDNSLITGRIIAAKVSEDALRVWDEDDQDLLMDAPLLAYLYPGRFAEIRATEVLPFPSGFKR